ncbi:MAG: copper chaperone PCu(A)C [Micrococcales bacterium]|nr:copper chaperone PCu(A)C [Micrococcales bacterium]
MARRARRSRSGTAPRFTIPAHGTLTLAPGGDHIMAMAMTRPLTGGTPVIVTSALADGSEGPL